MNEAEHSCRGSDREDDCPSTDESDIDTFLEYARDVIAENDLSYDSASFRDFEAMLRECVANHFLGSKADTDDSLTSEYSYSGYITEGSNASSSRQKSSLSLKKGIISDQAYYRLRGIIARKKTAFAIETSQSITNDEIENMVIVSNDDVSTCSLGSQVDFDSATNEDIVVDFVPSKMDSVQEFSASTTQLQSRDDAILHSKNRVTDYGSDSSDSLVDNRHAQRIRRRKVRKRAKNKKRLREESSITQNANSTALSLLLQSPKSKETALRFLSEHAPSLHRSVVARLELECNQKPRDFIQRMENSVKRNKNGDFPTPEKQRSLRGKVYKSGDSTYSKNSELEIDSTHAILPSLVKKGIIYCDIPRIEQTIDRKKQKVDALGKKQKVLDQLVAQRGWSTSEVNTTQKGMALAHKLRARRKAALQAAFLRSSGERQFGSNQSSKDSSEPTKPIQQDVEPTMVLVQHNLLPESPESENQLSSIEEKKTLKNLFDKTKRSLSYSVNRQEKESLLRNQTIEKVPKICTLAVSNEVVSPTKASPFKIIFSRSKGDTNYEVLSAESSLSDNPFCDSDSDYSGPIFDGMTSDNYDEGQAQVSDDSAWSEMSFHSEPNRFSVSSVSSFNSRRNSSHVSQTYRGARPLPIAMDELKALNDSFDEIVLRNTPNATDMKKGTDIGEPEPSPTGVMDLFCPQQKLKAYQVGDALAFVDEDEGDLVFTDKDDSFVMKSPEPIGIITRYQPLFFSPTRFEI